MSTPANVCKFESSQKGPAYCCTVIVLIAGMCVCLAAAVTALDFSQRNPHILGVGTHDGTIAVYDVRSRQPTPLMASTADTGKHADPVWKVRTSRVKSISALCCRCASSALP
jgi:WD40 repeat protein